MLHNNIDNKWTLVQVMAWCCEQQAITQAWPRSLSPYAIIRSPTMSLDELWHMNACTFTFGGGEPLFGQPVS